jgi:MFS superfamily sulfate permease-like transporter
VAARRSGLERFVPALSWVPGYQLSWLSKDAIAGFTILGSASWTTFAVGAVALVLLFTLDRVPRVPGYLAAWSCSPRPSWSAGR